MGLPLEAAYLIGTLASAALFGLYTSLFIRVLLTLSLKGQNRVIIVSAALGLQYICTVVAIGLQISGIFLAFIKYRDVLVPEAYYTGLYERQISAPIHLMLLISGLISDSLLCWRLYVIWNNNKAVLIAPVCLLVGLAITSSTAVALEFSSVKKGPEKNADHWSLAGFGLTIIVNVLVTTLICWRILRISRAVSDMTERTNPLYAKLVRALVESGGLYTFTILLYLLVSATGLAQVSVIVSYMLSIIVGIVPSLIVLRLHAELHKKTSSSRVESSSQGYSSGPSSRAQAGIRLSEIQFSRKPMDAKDTITSRISLSPTADGDKNPFGNKVDLDLQIVYTRDVETG